MRLWHQDLIPLLPRQQLLGQHRECCALRGRGWGRPHATINYVFDYSPYLLFRYHQLIMREMDVRGYKVSPEWQEKNYRGKTCSAYTDLKETPVTIPLYQEHNDTYYQECLENLRKKGIDI